MSKSFVEMNFSLRSAVCQRKALLNATEEEAASWEVALMCAAREREESKRTVNELKTKLVTCIPKEQRGRLGACMGGNLR